MNTICCTRLDVLEAFAEVAHGFSEAKADIANREKHFFDALANLMRNLEVAVSEVNKMPLSEAHPLAARVKEYVEVFSQQSQQWHNAVLDFQRGTEFREQFDDSFLVFVYGKVKAGKSSLGNYVAWGEMEPTEDTVGKNPEKEPVFKVHAQSTAKGGDLKNEAEFRKFFKTGETETTSSIQTFELPGLTWVDSPGIHSMQGENGKLAKDYVTSADLVVYTMSSLQPGRRSDIEEITGLLNQRKPLIILLTRSDKNEEDEDGDGNIVAKPVMKPLMDRNAQIEEVTKELNKLPEAQRQLISAEVLHISVKLAQMNEALPEAYIESGMSHLLARMREIARSDSVNLKMETPLNNLKTFGDGLLRSQRKLEERVNLLEQSVATALKELREAEKYVVTEVKRGISAEITRALGENRGDSQMISKRLNEKLKELVIRQTAEEIDKVFERMDGVVTKALTFPAVNLPGFQNVYKEVPVSDSGKKRVIGGTGAALAVAALCWWNPLGWAAGTVAAVSVVGSIVAGAAGSKVGESFASEETHHVPIGDNIETIEQEAHKVYPELAEQLVHAVFAESVAGGFTAMQSFVKDSQKALHDFGTTIEEKVMS